MYNFAAALCILLAAVVYLYLNIVNNIRQHTQSFQKHPQDILSEHADNDDHGAEMQQHIKEKSVRDLNSKKISKDRKMAGAADRQKFGNTLDESQEYRLYYRHIFSPLHKQI